MNKNRSALPVWIAGNHNILDGTLLKAPSICAKQKKGVCEKYYDEIRQRRGFHVCPAGCSSYSTGLVDEPIYSAIRVKDYYDRKKLKHEKEFMPTLPTEKVISFVRKSTIIAQESNDLQHDKELVEFCLHDIRKYNLEIKRIAETHLTSTQLSLPSKESLDNTFQTVFAASTSITNLLNIYDMEGNPGIVTAANPYSASPLGKFHKAKKCLSIYAKDRRIRIEPFRGSLKLQLDLYPIFDFVPHVILENAIKYSPSDQSVFVDFEEHAAGFAIKVSSIGPILEEKEEGKIFLKGGRGYMASEFDTSGGGYGLHFAKLICELHDIRISAKSLIDGEPIELNGIKYTTFEVELDYDQG